MAQYYGVELKEAYIMNSRSVNEIEHGKLLSAEDTEYIWGWGTPAGKVRAARRAELIAKGAQLRNGVYALEIGCGSGMFTEKFAETGAQLIAVDISPDLLAKARKRRLPPERVQFLEKRFEDCDVEGPFDAVIGSSILHHLDLFPALSKIYDLLKPGGKVCFAEPNLLNPHVFMERKFRKWFPYVSPDETAFITWKLRTDLKKQGFDKIEIQPFDWLHPSSPAPLINPISEIGYFFEKTPLLRHIAGSLCIYARRPPE